jgi:hypothetical protein
MRPDPTAQRPAPTPLASLRRYLRPRTPQERCGLCGLGLADEHAHLVEIATRRLVCACDPCAVLFPGREDARYRRVPRDAHFLADFPLSDAAWEVLSIPIDLAFFVRSTPLGRVVALYPSPGGAAEAPVDPEAWEVLAEEYPPLLRLEPDVECLLVNRVGGSRECYRAGIDRSYRLVGLVRTHWRGFSGGPAAWDEIGRFFADLKDRSRHA